jgi:hypothetical protein
MSRFQRNEQRDLNCQIGDFGVHLFDRTAKLEVGGFDGSLVLVRFSQNGKLHPCLRDELMFSWDQPKPKPTKKAKKQEKHDDDDDDDDDY